MYSRVCVQGRAPVKGFAALIALVWLFLKGNKRQVMACRLVSRVSVLAYGSSSPHPAPNAGHPSVPQRMGQTKPPVRPAQPPAAPPRCLEAAGQRRLPKKGEQGCLGERERREGKKGWRLTWVWMILCRQSVLACLKPFPQTLQTKGLAPVCTGIWRVKL